MKNNVFLKSTLRQLRSISLFARRRTGWEDITGP